MLTWDVQFQGQALAKINLGIVLDSYGDWTGAFQAYEEGYRQFIDSFLSRQILRKLACFDVAELLHEKVTSHRT
jgi:hypothetical protein